MNQIHDCYKAKDLLKAKMKIIDPEICEKYFTHVSHYPFDKKVHICAIGEKGGGICRVSRK